MAMTGEIFKKEQQKEARNKIDGLNIKERERRWTEASE